MGRNALIPTKQVHKKKRVLPEGSTRNLFFVCLPLTRAALCEAQSCAQATKSRRVALW